MLTELLDTLRQGPLRLLEPLEQAIFCQREEQYWDAAYGRSCLQSTLT